MADMPGPSNQGEREAYPIARRGRGPGTTEAGEVAGIQSQGQID
jgi:hypothetical protein